MQWEFTHKLKALSKKNHHNSDSFCPIYCVFSISCFVGDHDKRS